MWEVLRLKKKFNNSGYKEFNNDAEVIPYIYIYIIGMMPRSIINIPLLDECRIDISISNDFKNRSDSMY